MKVYIEFIFLDEFIKVYLYKYISVIFYFVCSHVVILQS